MMKIEILTPEDSGKIEQMARFVESHENSHFLQSPQWAAVKESWRWRGVLAYSGGRLAGAMSILIRPLPLGLSLLYAPRGPVCGRHDRAVFSALMEGARAVAKQFHALFFMADPDVPCEDEDFRAMAQTMGFRERVSDGFDNIQAQNVFRLALTGRSEEELFAAFHPKTRYNIRLARRRGVEIRRFRGDEEIPERAMDAFARLMEATGRRDHFLTRSKAYFQKVLSALGGNGVLFLACLDGVPIAGTIGVYYGRKAWYLYGASADEHRGAMPNYLLQWEMIRRAARLGCVFYDLRGVPGKPSEDDPLYGLYRFKKGFSGRYTRFTGLFIYPYRKLASALFWPLFTVYRRLRRLYKKTRRREAPGRMEIF